MHAPDAQVDLGPLGRHLSPARRLSKRCLPTRLVTSWMSLGRHGPCPLVFTLWSAGCHPSVAGCHPYVSWLSPHGNGRPLALQSRSLGREAPDRPTQLLRSPEGSTRGVRSGPRGTPPHMAPVRDARPLQAPAPAPAPAGAPTFGVLLQQRGAAVNPFAAQRQAQQQRGFANAFASRSSSHRVFQRCSSPAAAFRPSRIRDSPRCSSRASDRATAGAAAGAAAVCAARAGVPGKLPGAAAANHATSSGVRHDKQQYAQQRRLAAAAAAGRARAAGRPVGLVQPGDPVRRGARLRARARAAGQRPE